MATKSQIEQATTNKLLLATLLSSVRILYHLVQSTTPNGLFGCAVRFHFDKVLNRVGRNGQRRQSIFRGVKLADQTAKVKPTGHSLFASAWCSPSTVSPLSPMTHMQKYDKQGQRTQRRGDEWITTFPISQMLLDCPDHIYVYVYCISMSTCDKLPIHPTITR